jgi:hypothetical protein
MMLAQAKFGGSPSAGAAPPHLSIVNMAEGEMGDQGTVLATGSTSTPPT